MLIFPQESNLGVKLTLMAEFRRKLQEWQCFTTSQSRWHTWLLETWIEGFKTFKLKQLSVRYGS